MAAHASGHLPSQAMPASDRPSVNASRRAGGASIARTPSLSFCNVYASDSPGAPRAPRSRSCSEAIVALAGSVRAASMEPNGRTADAGVPTHEGRLPLSPARLRLLPPAAWGPSASACTTSSPQNCGCTSAWGPEPPGPPELVGGCPAGANWPSSTRRSAAPSGPTVTAVPTRAFRLSKTASEKHVANRAPVLRARTATCESRSGRSRVRTPATPCGISSSPPTWSTRSTVGEEYTSHWTSASRSTCASSPEASSGLMTCQSPSLALSRRRGSAALTSCERAAAGVPRMTSSANRAVTRSSHPSRGPRASAAGCSSSWAVPVLMATRFSTRSRLALTRRATPSSRA
mmetsp:Transcript_36356/g.102437  ORF Transcript_36356/g.102437 Transcript_36356/m.102437 type:complete len:346 (+) Transcript_36356:742-1779(+)